MRVPEKSLDGPWEAVIGRFLGDRSSWNELGATVAHLRDSCTIQIGYIQYASSAYRALLGKYQIVS